MIPLSIAGSFVIAWITSTIKRFGHHLELACLPRHISRILHPHRRSIFSGAQAAFTEVAATTLSVHRHHVRNIRTYDKRRCQARNCC